MPLLHKNADYKKITHFIQRPEITAGAVAMHVSYHIFPFDTTVAT